GKQFLRVTTSQKLVQNVLVDCHIDGPFSSIYMTSRTKFLTVPDGGSTAIIGRFGGLSDRSCDLPARS
ncbi:hypothetical protein, partial [Sphingomonas sp.]|uniref:hypothetical protein n=1 Tax=Sphingomonas sp. TaxID=28214 RepID=UPI003D6CEDB8